MTALRAYVNLICVLEIGPWALQTLRIHLFVSPKKGRAWHVLHCMVWEFWMILLPHHNGAGALLAHVVLIWLWGFFLGLAIHEWWAHRNDDDDDPPIKKKRLRAAASRMKAKLVERMKRLAPSPIPHPVGA